MEKQQRQKRSKLLRGFCTKCQQWKDLDDFYMVSKASSRRRSWCKECDKQLAKTRYHVEGSVGQLRNKKTLDARLALKRQLVAAAGSKCVHCGYNKSLNALDFHHKEDGSKQYTLADLIALAASGRGTHLSQALAEAAKCTLLCANCHRELHAGEWSL